MPKVKDPRRQLVSMAWHEKETADMRAALITASDVVKEGIERTRQAHAQAARDRRRLVILFGIVVVESLALAGLVAALLAARA